MKERTMTRLILAALAGVLAAPSTLSAVGSRHAAYVGGTNRQFHDAREPAKGQLDTSGDRALVFTVDGRPPQSDRIEIPYQNVTHIAYGQNVRRRVGTTIGTSLFLGPVGLLPLASKARRHYLTVGYSDTNGQTQLVVFELGKDIVRPLLAIIEARSGKSIDYQDDDAARLNR
jgi:hypothetical protein